MHELSIACSIIDIASNYAIEANARKIKEVELSIGLLAGVEIDALNLDGFKMPRLVRWGIYYTITLMVFLLASGQQEFIYFQF